MARPCVKCGKPVRFLVALSSSTRGQGPLCPECAAEERNAKWERERIETEQRQAAIVAAEEKRKSIVAEIQASKKLSPAGVQWLRSLSKDKAKDFYEVAYALFNTDSHMEVQELTTLWNIQNVARLSPEEIRYEDRVLAYTYGAMIEEGGGLPVINLEHEGASPVLLRRNEAVHFAKPAQLKEMKTVEVGYVGGSQGVSLRIAKGVYYRIGSSRGHLVKDEHYVVTSAGLFIITNQRVLLHPSAGNKPVSIDLKKILSYNCYENGLMIYKEGREKGFLFVLDKPMYNEIAGMCLSFLTANN